MPLYAVDENKQGYFSENCNTEIRRIRLFCPHCEGIVIFVEPSSEIIKHFRHKEKCPYHYEPETRRHIEMKLFIYAKLKKANYQKIEYPDSIKIGQNKPDVFAINDKGQKFAFEVQHSNISLKDFLRRCKTYKENEIYCLWIFDGYEWLKSPDAPFMCRDVWKTICGYTGRVYLYYKGEIIPFRPNLKRKKLSSGGTQGEKISNYNVFGQIYTLPLYLGQRKMEVEQDDFYFARFYDKKWWGDKNGEESTRRYLGYA